MTTLHLCLEANAVICQSAQFLLDSEIESNSDVRITLRILGGNVVHPNAIIQIVPPLESGEYTLCIKENNLFEEESFLSINLRTLDPDTKEIAIVGSYNLFSSKSQVRCKSIGNGNIFHPCCKIDGVKEIKHGNVFQSTLVLESGSKVPINTDSMVFFRDNSRIGFRSRLHINGVEKNMNNVSLLLRAVRKILRAEHRLYATVDTS